MNHAAPGSRRPAIPPFRKPLSVSPFTTQLTGGGLVRHGTR
jgi:hypothetical protein